MAGVLFLIGSTLAPLYSIDDKLRTGDNKACSDYIFISGASNINRFSFSYKPGNYSVINPFFSGNSGELILIEVPVKDFVASNPIMYNDFMDLLKADDYPLISITLSRDQPGPGKSGSEIFNREISLTIAGVTRTYPVNCTVTSCTGNFFIKGSEIIRLSDFLIRPPERLGGLIKVHDEINVSFGFIVNFTENNQISSQK